MVIGVRRLILHRRHLSCVGFEIVVEPSLSKGPRLSSRSQNRIGASDQVNWKKAITKIPTTERSLTWHQRMIRWRSEGNGRYNTF